MATIPLQKAWIEAQHLMWLLPSGQIMQASKHVLKENPNPSRTGLSKMEME